MFKPEHLQRYQAMRDRADRIRSMIHARAIAAYCEAFGGKPAANSHLDMCVIHNSLIAAERGQPWREVNYSKMRLAARLCGQTHAPRAIVDRWCQRVSRKGI